MTTPEGPRTAQELQDSLNAMNMTLGLLIGLLRMNQAVEPNQIEHLLRLVGRSLAASSDELQRARYVTALRDFQLSVGEDSGWPT